MPAWYDALITACVEAKTNGQATLDLTGMPGCRGGTATVRMAGSGAAGAAGVAETDGVGKGEMVSCLCFDWGVMLTNFCVLAAESKDKQ